MIQIKGKEIGLCSSCGNPIGDENPHVWCLNCGQPLSMEVKSQIPQLDKFELPAAPERINLSKGSNGVVSAMRFIGWGNLLVSLVLAFFVLTNSGSGAARGTYYTDKAADFLAFITTLGIIAQGIITLIICLSVAHVSENVENVKNRLDKISPEK